MSHVDPLEFLATLTDGAGYLPEDVFEQTLAADPRLAAMWKAIRSMIVPQSRYDAVFKQLDHMLKSKGSGRETECSLIYGLSGLGKSTSIFSYVYDGTKGPFRTKAGLKRPILLVQTPSRPTLGNLYEAMLDALDASELRGKLADMKKTFRDQVENQGVRLVIFDEFTHLLEDRSDKFARHVAREVKGFINDNLFNVVFVGTEQLVGIYAIYPQLRRRSTGDLALTPFDWEDDDDRDEWKDILEVLSEGLPIVPVEPFNEVALARTLHLCCDGRISGLMKLLCAACTNAQELGDDRLTQSHLWEGFERVATTLDDGTQKVNPFTKPKGRRPRPRLLVRPEGPGAETGLRSNGRRESKAGATFAK